MYAAHVVHNKINNHNRKWIRRTQRGITSKLVFTGHGPTGLQLKSLDTPTNWPLTEQCAAVLADLFWINHYMISGS